VPDSGDPRLSCDHPLLRITVRNRQRYNCPLDEGGCGAIVTLIGANLEQENWIPQENILEMEWWIGKYGLEKFANALMMPIPRLDRAKKDSALKSFIHLVNELQGVLPEAEAQYALIAADAGKEPERSESDLLG